MTRPAGAGAVFVTGVGTAVPAACYAQRDVYAALRAAPQFAFLENRSRALLAGLLLRDNGVRTRHLALDSLSDVFELDPDVMAARFSQHAPRLAAQAGAAALRRSGCAREEIDALLVSTCTGMLCPGLTSHVAERLGLRPDILALDLVGQGCGAALPNLRTAAGLLRSGAYRKALCICVEVCSAALYIDDDPGVLVSACLFGDGAGAAVLSSGACGESRTVEWVDAFSASDPAQRESLRMEHRGGLLRNILGREVPAIAAERVSTLLADGLLASHVSPDEISAWIWHAGGRNVLARVREATALREEDMVLSAEVLERYGNLSSPFVLFVLQAALERKPGGWWWMCSFGAGFSCHGALLRVGND